jgi:ribosomal protein L37E
MDTIPAPHGYRTLICTYCGRTIDVPIHCSSRTCPPCTHSRSLRIRKRISWSLSKLSRTPTDRWRHIVLTIPNSADLESALNHLIRSFRKLRSTPWWKSIQLGGYYVIEVSNIGNLWHPHLHVISYGGYIPLPQLVRWWRRSSISGTHVKLVSIWDGVNIASYISKYVSKVPLLNPGDSKHLDSVAHHRRFFSPFGNIQLLLKAYPMPKFKQVCSRCGYAAWVPDFVLDILMRQAHTR